MIHTIPDSAALYAALDAGAPGDRYVLDGGIYDSLDSYTQRIVGGATWGARTRIEARVRAGKRDEVTLRANGGKHVVHLADLMNSNLELIGLVLDAADVTSDAIKTTWSGDRANCAAFVRLTDCIVRNAPTGNGWLIAGAPRCSSIGARYLNNGGADWRFHGVYCDSPGFVCEHSTFRFNAGWGLHLYDGSGKRGPSDARIIGNRATGNGLSGRGGGMVFGSGNRMEVAWNICRKNPIGMWIGHGVDRVSAHDNTVSDNRDAQLHRDGTDTNTREWDNETA